jgi:hypothetical protein
MVVIAFGAVAQQTPIVELRGQYQMLRVNSSRNTPAFTANGGTESVLAVLKVGAVYNGDIHNIQLNNTYNGAQDSKTNGSYRRTASSIRRLGFPASSPQRRSVYTVSEENAPLSWLTMPRPCPRCSHW